MLYWYQNVRRADNYSSLNKVYKLLHYPWLERDQTHITIHEQGCKMVTAFY